MQEEIWKPIKDYDGLYEVSNYGRVKSLKRNVRANTCGIRVLPEKILSACKSSCGYKLVVLCENGKHHSINVHRLVAEAFIPNPNNYKEVNHKDEDKTNNKVENLEWCDRKYNANYGTGIERCSSKRCKPVAMIDLETNQVIKEFPSAKKAMDCTNIDRNLIGMVCLGKTKSAGGYFWKFI